MNTLRTLTLALLILPQASFAEQCTALAQKVRDLDYAKASELMATPTASFASLYDECDSGDTFLGKPLPDYHGIAMRCSSDPNRVERLVQFQDKTVVFEAKAGVDADGSPVSCGPEKSKTDQCETWFTFDPGQSKNYIDAEQVPFVVVPSASSLADKKNPLSNVSFMRASGVKKGDLAVAIYKDNCSFGVVGDAGPYFRLGEISLASQSDLGNPQCRGEEKPCTKLRGPGGSGIGIAKGVTYIIFPGSRPNPLTPENIVSVSSTGAKKALDEFVYANKKCECD